MDRVRFSYGKTFMTFCVYLPRSMKLAWDCRLPGRCRVTALLPGPEYPVAHGSGAGGQGKKWPMPEKSFRENLRDGEKAW